MPTVIELSGSPIGSIVGWAETPPSKARGLMGRADLVDHGVFVLCGAKQIHTFGIHRTIDIALCDRDWNVLHVAHSMPPNRIGRLKLRAKYAIEARDGALAEVQQGDRLSLKDR